MLCYHRRALPPGSTAGSRSCVYRGKDLQEIAGTARQKAKHLAECLFADPVADIAVLGTPDGQSPDASPFIVKRGVSESLPTCPAGRTRRQPWPPVPALECRRPRRPGGTGGAGRRGTPGTTSPRIPGNFIWDR